jgi:hypothetical protein
LHEGAAVAHEAERPGDNAFEQQRLLVSRSDRSNKRLK